MKRLFLLLTLIPFYMSAGDDSPKIDCTKEILMKTVIRKLEGKDGTRYTSATYPVYCNSKGNHIARDGTTTTAKVIDAYKGFLFENKNGRFIETVAYSVHKYEAQFMDYSITSDVKWLYDADAQRCFEKLAAAYKMQQEANKKIQAKL